MKQDKFQKNMKEARGRYYNKLMIERSRQLKIGGNVKL